MQTTDQLRAAAEKHIRNAVNMLQAVHLNRLDHSDRIVAKVALEGLGIVLRSMAGDAARANDARIAKRLRQVAAEIDTCGNPDVRAASKKVEAAASVYQSIAGEG